MSGPLTVALTREIERHVGPIERVESLGRASQAEVWSVRLRAGDRVVVKCPHDAASFGREAKAYRTWVPQLGPHAPTLRAQLEPPLNAFVLEWIDGVAATDSNVDGATRRAMHRQAGRVCRTLAELPCPDSDPMALSDALLARVAGWCRRGESLLTQATLDAVRESFDAEAFHGVGRVHAHRDFSPWNWLVVRDPAPRLVVVDFGQARSDAPLTDLVKLWDRPWVEDEGARVAFFEGFGRALTDHEQHQLRQLTILHGVASAVWGREHRAAQYAAIGDAVLRRVLAR